MATWNTDWTAASGELLADAVTGGSVLRMFVDAYNERAQAAGVATTTYGTAGDAALTKWKGLVSSTIALAPRYVRTVDDAGAAYSFEGEAFIDSCTFTAGSVAVPFPSPDGWLRRFPREITTTGAAGLAGQRARFVAAIEGNRALSGKFYDHSGGAWVQSADQTSDADIEEVYATAPITGDYFDGYFINTLQEMLNQMTRTMGTIGLTHRAVNNSFNVEFTERAIRSHGSYEATTALADAGYDAASFVSTVSPDAVQVYTEKKAPGYQALRRRAKWRNSNALPNPSGLNREPTYWVWAQKLTRTGTSVFSDHGDGVLEDVWHQTSSGAAASGTAIGTFTGALLGDHGTRPTPYPASGADDIIGYTAFNQAIMLDWAVSGGFTYVRP